MLLGSLFRLLFLMTLVFPTALLAGQQVMLQPHFSVLEDRRGSLSAADVLKHPDVLVPLDSFRQGYPTSYYWLKTELHTGKAASDPRCVLSLRNFTYVDVYLYQGDSLLIHKQAGVFRKRSEINESDGRMYTLLPLEPGKTYTLLLQVHHTKHYQPVFDFSLQTKRDYFQKLRFKETLDSALQGAVCLFFVYTLLSWIVSRYKPYLWLSLFIGGIGLYVISSAGYFIEWFFPEDPPTGWLFNIHFLDLGLLGAYLLLRDFWQLKKNYPTYYRWVKWIPALLAASSLTYFIIDYFTCNYNLTNNIHLWEHPLFLTVIVSAVRTCWRDLNSAQRYLAYGFFLIASARWAITVNSIFHQDRALAVSPVISDHANPSVVL